MVLPPWSPWARILIPLRLHARPSSSWGRSTGRGCAADCVTRQNASVLPTFWLPGARNICWTTTCSYASHQMLPALDFLLKQSPTPFDWSSGRPVAPTERLASLLGWLSENRMDLIYVNLTPPELERRRLFAARVIIPGCQPIAFGAGERRFGGSRLYELPVKLNLAKCPLEVAEAESRPASDGMSYPPPRAR